jgi:hypothetical protein
VTKWWIIMSVSSLASSFPGQACTPLPNGMKVFGFGETWMKKNHKIIIYMFVWKNYILKILLSIDSFIPQTLKGWICEALEKILDCDEYFWTMALLSTLLVLGILFHNILMWVIFFMCMIIFWVYILMSLFIVFQSYPCTLHQLLLL